ncbi:DMT family transporter [Paenibacillus yanchengensis]|uniref:DMT family transporter n=1 Tax=Paenibacillus yanchengensis TaxID=2035833 RepID=A0ABW4YQ24_9BACL
MNAFVLLGLAIIFEVFGSTMMKLSNGFKRWWPVLGLIVGMSISFILFSKVLQQIPLSAAYAIWSGLGTALTALVGVYLFKEVMNRKKALALLCIIGGVVLMRLA